MAPLLLIGAALGGAAMYLFDPDRGRRRRALLRDQAVKARRQLRETVDAGTRDLANRGAAVPRRALSMLRRGPVADDVLVERVRAKMGRYVAHPGAIEVTATDGRITLGGSILAHEHPDFLQVVRSVSGVKDIADRLVVHKTADHIPQLQGGRPRHGERMELLQERWAPGTRLVTGTAATALGLFALRSGAIVGPIAIVAGAALLVRTIANKPMRRAMARFIATGPKTGLDEDLTRLKSTPKTRKPPRDALRGSASSVEATGHPEWR